MWQPENEGSVPEEDAEGDERGEREVEEKPDEVLNEDVSAETEQPAVNVRRRHKTPRHQQITQFLFMKELYALSILHEESSLLALRGSFSLMRH